jgi:phage gp45-like
VVIHADGTIEVVASTKVQISSPLVNMSGSLTVQGNIVAQGDISDHGNKAMAGMRGTYNGHTHTDPQGGTVPAPNQAM